MKVLGIIPARYGSTRFPGKPLVDILGKSMIQRVYEQAFQAKRLDKVVVATDDQRIFDHVLAFGGSVVMTADSHESGTDRCYEVIQKLEETFDVAINIQGDEPYIPPVQIDQLINTFDQEDTQIATLAKAITSPEHLANPNKVKVIFDAEKQSIYFSRHAIPFQKSHPIEAWLAHHAYYGHIGIYGYRTQILQKITALKPSKLEIAESLEQLRWIENGYKVRVELTTTESVAIDTPEDLENLLKSL